MFGTIAGCETFTESVWVLEGPYANRDVLDAALKTEAFNIALVLNSQGNHGEVIPWWSNVIEVDPHDPEVHFP